jgi:uncharacterized cupin superfamily protein
MIKFNDFCTTDAKKDNAVGISIKEMIQNNGLHAYATALEEGNKVRCHSHHKGEEWYIILSGEGTIFTSDVKEDVLGVTTETTFKKGSIFCILPDTAHQLCAHTKVELIFLCPPAHLSFDRTGFADIC